MKLQPCLTAEPPKVPPSRHSPRTWISLGASKHGSSPRKRTTRVKWCASAREGGGNLKGGDREPLEDPDGEDARGGVALRLPDHAEAHSAALARPVLVPVLVLTRLEVPPGRGGRERGRGEVRAGRGEGAVHEPVAEGEPLDEGPQGEAQVGPAERQRSDLAMFRKKGGYPSRPEEFKGPHSTSGVSTRVAVMGVLDGV